MRLQTTKIAMLTGLLWVGLGAYADEVEDGYDASIFNATCTWVTQTLYENNINPGTLAAHYGAYLKFALKHPYNGHASITLEDVRHRVLEVINDADANPFSRSVRATISDTNAKGVQDNTTKNKLILISMALLSPERAHVHPNYLRYRDALDVELERIYTHLESTSIIPKNALPSVKNSLFNQLRQFTHTHAVIQWRISDGSINMTDCVRRGLGDMFRDKALRAAPSFKWLKDAYERYDGDFYRMGLIPPYDDVGATR